MTNHKNARLILSIAGLASTLSALAPMQAVRADDIAPGIIPKVQPAEGVLNLRTGDVNTALLQDALLGTEFVADRMYVLVLDGPMTPAKRDTLTNAGVSLRGYLPTNSFVADLTNTTPARVRETGFVLRAVAFDPAWTVSNELLAGAHARAWQTPERQQLANQGLVAARLWLFEQEPAGPTLNALNTLPNTQVHLVETVGPGSMIEVTLPANQAAALTALPGLQFAEPIIELGERSNTTTRWIVQSNVLNSRPLYDRGLTGVGQVVGVIDGRVDSAHCSFFDSGKPFGPTHRKILAYNTSNGSDRHGTHVAGTLLGDAGTDNTNTRGVAYGAKMVFNTYPFVGSESSAISRFALHYSQGAAIHTNSWGSLDYYLEYDGLCRGIDLVSHDFDDNLIVFAVGNTFPTVANPENAKNCLGVAASDTSPNQGSFCSGSPAPTMDGRRKPEVTAPGCGIFSSAFSTTCGTLLLQGTSMATPAVSGVATLMRQYFTSGFYPSGVATPSDAFIPSGSLLKSMLVNSAVDMTGLAGFPSAFEGWGRVLADNAVFFAGDARKLVLRDVRNGSPDSLATGQSSLIAVNSQPSASGPVLPLKITLAYADAPASISATFTPVNDLNLVVTAPDGTEYLGNVFDSGESAPGGSADTLNNLEQVLITNPANGRWTVRVDGFAVNDGTQGYALVVTGGVSELPACIGDFDASGGTPDTGDIDAYFTAWLAGDPAADVDLSGATPDASDIEVFFAAWLAGC